MSTKLNFKEPPNTLIFAEDYNCMTAVYTSEQVRLDKKNKELVYSVKWLLTGYANYKLVFYGALQTSLEADDDFSAEERIQEIANFAKRVIEAAYQEKNTEVLEEHDGREIIAAIHGRYLSKHLHDEELGDAVLSMREFLRELNVKNVKKLLSDIFGNKVVEDIKNKELK